MTSIYACNAPEIHNSAFQRSCVFHFEGLASWIDVGLQVLRHVGWPPECSPAIRLDISRLLPPEQRTARGTVRFRRQKNEEQTSSEKNEPRGAKNPITHIRAAAAEVWKDKMGLTVCVIHREGYPIHRSVILHGIVLTPNVPVYLDEVVVAHTLRAVREWYESAPLNITEHLDEIEISVGTGRVVKGIESWCLKGVLKLQSAAATAVVVELQKLAEWLPMKGMILTPLWLPEEIPPEEMPWRIQGLFITAEEFRAEMAQATEEDWAKNLPRIPLVKSEVRDLIRTQMAADELIAFKQPAGLGSASATLLVGLQLTRDTVKEALDKLQDDRGAQITLLSVLSATRFRIYSHGRALPTKCGKCRVHPDTFDHMLRCYVLQESLVRGPGAVNFLVELAVRTKVVPPGVSVPFVRDL